MFPLLEDPNDNLFVRMLDITTAFQALKANPVLLQSYRERYAFTVQTIKDDKQITKHTEAVAALEEYFAKHSYLQQAQKAFFESVFGYILQNRYQRITLKSDEAVAAFENKFKEYIERYTTADNRNKTRRYASIAYTLAPSQDKESISRIIYGKEFSELKRTQQRLIEDAVDLHRVMNAGLEFDTSRSYDNHVLAAMETHALISQSETEPSINWAKTNKEYVELTTSLKELRDDLFVLYQNNVSKQLPKDDSGRTIRSNTSKESDFEIMDNNVQQKAIQLEKEIETKQQPPQC